MQRYSRRWFRGWAGVALFAMLAVLTSPALAFACCCSQETVALQAPRTVAPPVQKTPSHPGCSGHAETGKAEAQANRASASNSSQAVSLTPSQLPHLQSLCECGHANDSAPAFASAPQNSSFSPLVMGIAVRPLSFAVESATSVRLACAPIAARPRGPDTRLRSGRAPPA